MDVNKNMRKITTTIFFLYLCFFVQAHSDKARFHVIIDTDGAADDLRAICMLLSNREVKTLAITTSEGALTPEVAALKVSALLNRFHHQGIPVGFGRSLGITPPAWRRQSEQISWGDDSNITPSKQTAKDLIIQEIENENEKVIIICLGALTNLNDALIARPDLTDRIERVIWYNTSVNPLRGSNYDADRVSAEEVLASGVRVDAVSAATAHEITIDGQYIEMLAEIENNQYTEKIVETHSSSVLKPVVESRHMKMWDDLAVIYLFMPQLFTAERINDNISVYSLADTEMAAFARMIAVKILEGNSERESRVFFGFPDDPDLYAADVAPVVKKIIALHGRSEWRAGVLTNELHGHLGIYAIVGVKMGIRAREYFNIGVDDIKIVTYAGLQPPVSCINDGLQVSTGGTLGHGLISVAADEYIRPEATFTFKNKTIRMKLKSEYAQQIRRDVEEAILRHGNLTEPYWQQIRVLAIKYWEEFCRHEIFDMIVEN